MVKSYTKEKEECDYSRLTSITVYVLLLIMDLTQRSNRVNKTIDTKETVRLQDLERLTLSIPNGHPVSSANTSFYTWSGYIGSMAILFRSTLSFSSGPENFTPFQHDEKQSDWVNRYLSAQG
ncbi:MAG: hypothetical protein M2R45_02717 [Verrucomicrobia subdivision 3 bacterium]|nr:hypothetical protein [Limisphaerales bacterium]MCS1415057.1 hypothetical protein [Limisphaerales bacterium]